MVFERFKLGLDGFCLFVRLLQLNFWVSSRIDARYSRAIPVAFSNSHPTSLLLHLQHGQVRRNALVRDVLGSSVSEGMTCNAAVQWGQAKHDRAHLASMSAVKSCTDLFLSPLTLADGTSNKQLGQ